MAAFEGLVLTQRRETALRGFELTPASPLLGSGLGAAGPYSLVSARRTVWFGLLPGKVSPFRSILTKRWSPRNRHARRAKITLNPFGFCESRPRLGSQCPRNQ